MTFFIQPENQQKKVINGNLSGAGEGNRTPVISLGSWNSAIELHPHESIGILSHFDVIVK